MIFYGKTKILIPDVDVLQEPYDIFSLFIFWYFFVESANIFGDRRSISENKRNEKGAK
jgi:hypothetical protein